MIFFMAVVSPSVFATLSTNASSKFLRTIFPRMFLFGFIIALLSLILSYISANNLNSILLVIVAVSFIINRNYLTPKINNLRDKELEGDQKASSNFNNISLALFILPRVMYSSPRYSCAPKCSGFASKAILYASKALSRFGSLCFL